MSKQDHATKLLREQLCKKEAVQRKNLLAVSRLCIQTLCDESGTQGVVEDASPTLSNFCNVLEHIFCHGLKAGKRPVGSVENIVFWEFIKQACQSVPYNCLSKISAMDDLKSVRGKGRAWIKMALMEKRLSEYLSVALMEETLIKRFYEPCSFLGNEEASILSNVLTALNSVDFSLCLRNASFDQPIMYTVDYSMFLKYPISDRQLDLEEALLKMERKQNDTASTCSGHTSMSERDPIITTEEELVKIKRTMKIVVDQKVYLEEMLHLKELQCTELSDRVMETFEAAEGEKKLSDSIIMELQEQLADMHLKYRKVQDRLVDRKSDVANNVEESFHGEMDSVIARSKYSVSLHKPQEGVDVVADMERNGCSRSNSDQSVHRSDQSVHRSDQSVHRSDQSIPRSDTSVHRPDQRMHRSDSSIHRSDKNAVNRLVRSDTSISSPQRGSSKSDKTRSSSHSNLKSGSDRKSSSDRTSGSDRTTKHNTRPRSIAQQKIAGAVEDLLPSEKEKLLFAIHKKLHAESIISFEDPETTHHV